MDFGPMNNAEIAHKLERMAMLMEIRGEDRYRVRSYRNAAELIETWATPLSQIATEEGSKGLQELPGVGKAISGKIVELLETGTFAAYDKLTAETPESVLDLLDVSGIGLKTAGTLYRQFKITTLTDLAQFVAGGGLELVDGVGEKSAERIKESLGRLGYQL
ncbi:MAG: helix-hairpin-helix domain-containing protein [Pyrinomonadaceae bacterium]